MSDENTFVFQAELLRVDGGGCLLEVPPEIVAGFGTRGRIPILGTLNNAPIRSSFMPMCGRHILAVNREMREAADVAVGDTVQLCVRVDTEPRTVQVPEDMRAALMAHPTAHTAFERMSYTHRKEYVRAVLDAKRPETRARRIEQTVATLTAKTVEKERRAE
jgi:hypothetical protein